ncbi:MAG: methyltransferase [Desulfobacterales bacterium]|nr:methyltransferase [Desulfobacterales bacterium]
MKIESWHPGKILELSGFYWKTCTLHAAVKLDIFTIINDQALTGETIAKNIGADIDGTNRLLNAVSAMGLLDKIGDKFSNTDVAKKYLCKNSNGYLGFMIMHHHHLIASWARLDEAVQNGKPVQTRASFSDESRREAFLMGMFNNAMLLAPSLVKEFDLSGRRHLLDMGGGPGTYAIHFCLNNPNLKATVYDLPTTRPFAEKTIAGFGLSNRIDFINGDYVDGDLAGSYDVVWMSHILHAEGPKTCRFMIQKAVSTLEPGGMIMIHDFILDNTKDNPLFPALFSLNMLVGTNEGQAYSEQEIIDILAACGVKEIQRSSFHGPMDSGVIFGYV